jgi:DNA-binding XRE family transcriptional regulator
MTATNVPEYKVKEEGQSKACIVADHKRLESIQNIFIDTDLSIAFRDKLSGLLKDRDCSLYIIDTAVKDMDKWPALLSNVHDAWAKEWLFLISKYTDALNVQPLPQNSRFLDSNNLSVEKIASLIKKQLDPESRKRFAKARYLEEMRTITVWMENGKVYSLNIAGLPEADSTMVIKCSVSRDRSYVKVTQKSGKILEIPWDYVLYHCEPQYEFYKGKQAGNTSSDDNKIGERVKRIRESKGYSVQVLADKAKMKRPNLSRLEHGHHQPSLDTLERIAEALGVPLVDIVAKPL